MITKKIEEKNWHGNYDANFSELTGKTLTKIEGGLGDDTLTFHCESGERYQLHYYQDCCANCSIEDICGDLDDILRSRILLAEMVCSADPSEDIIAKRKAEYEEARARFKPRRDGDEFYWYGPSPDNDWQEGSETWSFYKLSTIKGSVTIRWYGSSNGYYSETVTFERLP